MTTEEKIKVMQAYEEGNPIQVIKLHVDETRMPYFLWVDVDEPDWDWSLNIYRVKPEEKKPTYRAYRDTAEMIADYKERFGVDVPPYAMPLIWVKSGENTSLINSYELDSVWVKMPYGCISLVTLFDLCTYLDGSPCGKLVEE